MSCVLDTLREGGVMSVAPDCDEFVLVPCVRVSVCSFGQPGSALDRFLHADELLRLWRQEEEDEGAMEGGDEVSGSPRV